MLTAACPACGAPVRFRGATSIVAVCAHCTSTLVRDGVQVQDIGRAAQVIDDHSPLQLDAIGNLQGVAFTVAGRVQYRYGAGTWSEWHLVFANGRSGWLSDDMGEHVLEFLQAPAALPPREALQVGTPVTLAGGRFEVAEISASDVIAIQGELPVRVTPGSAVQTIDLRDAEGRFATLDYGADPQAQRPQAIYLGKAVTLQALRMSGLRSAGDTLATGRAAPTLAARAFDCPGCGAPLTCKLARTEAIACGSCGAVMDVTDTRHRIISRSREALAQLAPVIPLGAVADLQGEAFEVVGLMRRSMQSEGLRYSWDEYLLHALGAGYRFLVNENGHWGLAKLTGSAPKVESGPQPTVTFLGRRYRHYARYVARVDAVVGEFFWRVQVGEQVKVDDFVAPPNLLSRELSKDESVWSLEEYLAPERVWAAFKMKGEPPRPHGLAAHQPPPDDGQLKPLVLACALFAVAALALHLLLGLTVNGRVVLRQPVDALARGQANAFESQPFDIPGRSPAPLAVRSSFGVVNSWVGLDFNLVNVATGENYAFGEDVSYYSDGPGDDEPEGSQSHALRVLDIPPGRYVLQIDTEGDPDRAQLVPGTVEVYRAAPSWANLVVAWIALALGPLVLWLRRASFEKRRWADSDHAPADQDDDDDDD